MSLATGHDLPVHVPLGMEEMLQNKQLFTAMHQYAENANPLFTHLHPLLGAKISELDNDTAAKAFMRGIGIYEIVSSFDNPQDPLDDDEGQLAIGKLCTLLSQQLTLEELLDNAQENYEDSRFETPRLLQFGQDVLDRYVPDDNMMGFGVLGIAAARQWHMSAQVVRDRLITQQIELIS